MTTAPATSSNKPSIPPNASVRSPAMPAGPVTYTDSPSGGPFASSARRASMLSEISPEESTGTIIWIA